MVPPQAAPSARSAASGTDIGTSSRHFKVEKFLGKGSFGSVYMVRRLSDGHAYAMKVRFCFNIALIVTAEPFRP